MNPQILIDELVFALRIARPYVEHSAVKLAQTGEVANIHRSVASDRLQMVDTALARAAEHLNPEPVGAWRSRTGERTGEFR